VNEEKALAHGLHHLLRQADREVADAYGVQVTPSAVLIKEGAIASPLAAGATEIRNIVFDATLPPPVSRGEAAPRLKLADLDGRELDFGTLRQRTVLLFWNPACGFCESMLKDLKAWERTRPRTAPALLVISTGSVDTNRQQGFRARVLLDATFGAGRVFGSSGTPSALLLDEHGKVGSDVIVGAEGVLALLQGTVVLDAVPA
jgi:thioredoxin-related protein